MSKEESNFNLLKSDFPNIDFSFIRNDSNITYHLSNDVCEFSENFFKSLETESPNFSTFILEGLDFIKYSSKSITGSPILGYSIRIDEENKCSYHFMGVK